MFEKIRNRKRWKAKKKKFFNKRVISFEVNYKSAEYTWDNFEGSWWRYSTYNSKPKEVLKRKLSPYGETPSWKMFFNAHRVAIESMECEGHRVELEYKLKSKTIISFKTEDGVVKDPIKHDTMTKAYIHRGIDVPNYMNDYMGYGDTPINNGTWILDIDTMKRNGTYPNSTEELQEQIDIALKTIKREKSLESLLD